MTASMLVQECDKRGITLALLPPAAPGELPQLHVRGKQKPPAKVLECFKEHKAQIIAVLQERGETAVVAKAKAQPSDVPSPIPTPVPDALPLPLPTDLAFDAELVAEGREVEQAFSLLIDRQRAVRVDPEYRDLLCSLRAAAFGNRIPPHEPVTLHPGTTIADVNRWFMLTLDRAQSITDKMHDATRKSLHAEHERLQDALEHIGGELGTVAQWWQEQGRMLGEASHA